MKTALTATLLLLGFSIPVWSEEDPLLSNPFVIRVLDEETKRPVPLVELKTTHNVSLFTDNAGIAAFDEPGFAKKKIYFHVSSPGYSVPEDGFGNRGKRLVITPGETTEILVTRDQIAERMFRITGAGRYHHSARAGLPVPDWAMPPINSAVFGQDSAHTTEYKGKLFWIWGDTSKPGYPLGIFDTAAATSSLPAPDPAAAGITLSYFEDDQGEVRGVAKMPGDGPTWIGGLAVLKDEDGKDHLVASYAKIRGFVDVYQRGLCEWDPEKEEFLQVLTFPDKYLKDSHILPEGHPIRHKVGDTEYLYFGLSFPTMRIPATYEAWKKLSAYEPVKSDASLIDVETGKKVTPHYGSIEWNPYRKKFIGIFAQPPMDGNGLTDTWITEAPAPDGPWRKAVRLATHAPHSFYNPKQHPEFSQEDGRIIYFEGTYTTLFAKDAIATPRYDYNQILYRVDLDRVIEKLDAGKPE